MGNIVGAIRLANMVDNFWASREQKKIDEEKAKYWADVEATKAWAEEMLMTYDYLEYLAKPDKMGYLKALGKAKVVFRQLDRKDPYEGMVKNGGINPEFVAMVEDCYKEVRPKAHLGLMKYENFRDTKIELDKNDPVLIEYAKNVYGITREEMFERMKRNDLIVCLSFKANQWGFITPAYYKNVASSGKGSVTYPLDLLEHIQASETNTL